MKAFQKVIVGCFQYAMVSGLSTKSGSRKGALRTQTKKEDQTYYLALKKQRSVNVSTLKVHYGHQTATAPYKVHFSHAYKEKSKEGELPFW